MLFYRHAPHDFQMSFAIHFCFTTFFTRSFRFPLFHFYVHFFLIKLLSENQRGEKHLPCPDRGYQLSTESHLTPIEQIVHCWTGRQSECLYNFAQGKANWSGYQVYRMLQALDNKYKIKRCNSEFAYSNATDSFACDSLWLLQLKCVEILIQLSRGNAWYLFGKIFSILQSA